MPFTCSFIGILIILQMFICQGLSIVSFNILIVYSDSCKYTHVQPLVVVMLKSGTTKTFLELMQYSSGIIFVDTHLLQVYLGVYGPR